MDQKKDKEGLSVREIESFARKHRFEVFLCLAFVLSCFFTFVMWGAVWSIVSLTAGAILGVFFSEKVAGLSRMIFYFLFKQEPTTQLVLGVIALVLAIFIPPLYFLLLGLHGGKDMYHRAMEIHSSSLHKDHKDQ